MKENILLVEDEEDLRTTLSDRLENERYIVRSTQTAEEAYDLLTQVPFDLVILDVMLPHKNGFDLCRDIRQAGLAIPILMLTARGETFDKVLGLKLGADDYLAKPFDMMELLARIEALLRRAGNKIPAPDGLLRFGNIQVNLRGTEVQKDGQIIPLSAREFQLLRHFIENRGKTLSRAELLQEVWGYSTATFTRTVDVHVSSLRQKLETDPKKPSLITTVPGMGYKFSA
jgi:two-component system alkaline phosphatase synthesis response regulator PhoP